MTADSDRRHAEKMRRIQAARRDMMTTKTGEKGLLIVHTGAGKGKSTAAFGMALRAMGEGFTWDTQDRARDIAVARTAWEEVKRMIADPDYAMVIADELNIVLRYAYLPVDEVIEAAAARPPMKHLVITGRNAPQSLIDAADLVTEMTPIKHPFRGGIKAQAGIEF